MLLNLALAALGSSSLPDRVEHLHALPQFLVLLNRWVIRIVFAEEGSRRDEALVHIACAGPLIAIA